MRSSARSFDLFLMGLQFLFIYLKLTGEIDWSWWWVLSPALFSLIPWIVIGVFFVGMAVFFGAVKVAGLFNR